MSETPRPQPEQENDPLYGTITKAAEEAYAEIGPLFDVDPENAHHARICEPISRKLHDKLTDEGLPSYLKQGADWQVSHHQFVGIPQEEDELTVDPTWQQFLPTPSSDQPKILIAKKSELAEILTKGGIPKERHGIWLHARQLSPDSEE